MSGHDGSPSATNGGAELFTRDMLPASPQVGFELVYVPEWKATVRLRGLTLNEKDEFDKSLIAGKGGKQHVEVRGMRAKLLVRCIVDAQGNRLFTDDEWVKLGSHPAQVIDRLYQPAALLSAHSAKDEEELEDIAGNSTGDRSGASS